MNHHRCKLLAGQTAHDFSNEFANEVTIKDAKELADKVADKVASFADLRQIRSSRTVQLRRRRGAPVELIEAQVRHPGGK
jgi:hypothetical protein